MRLLRRCLIACLFHSLACTEELVPLHQPREEPARTPTAQVPPDSPTEPAEPPAPSEPPPTPEQPPSEPQEPPFVPPPDPPPVYCEDDADFCEGRDAPEAGVDLLAGWSRVEGELFLVDLLFAGPIFPDSRTVNVNLVFDTDHDESTGRQGFIEHWRGEWMHESSWDSSIFMTSSAPWYRYPPLITLGGPFDQPCSMGAVTSDKRVLEFRLPLSMVTTDPALPPKYAVIVNFGGSIFSHTETQPRPPATLLQSTGGAMDGVTFASFCDVEDESHNESQ